MISDPRFFPGHPTTESAVSNKGSQQIPITSGENELASDESCDAHVSTGDGVNAD